MSNQLYALGRQGFLDGSFNWNDTISIALVSNLYEPSLSTDEFLSQLPSGCIVSTVTDLGGKSVTNGIANSENPLFVAVMGDPIIYVVIYQDTGNPATSRLIALIDTAAGLPLVPKGEDITLLWDTWFNGIFAL